jgi:hypothetical protein
MQCQVKQYLRKSACSLRGLKLKVLHLQIEEHWVISFLGDSLPPYHFLQQEDGSCSAGMEDEMFCLMPGTKYIISERLLVLVLMIFKKITVMA